MGRTNRGIRHGIVYNRRLLGYDKVSFTRHALDRMKQRRITREEVYRAIEKPDETGLPTEPGRIRVRWNKTERHAVDIVYKLRENDVRVITAIRITLDAERGSPPKILRARKQQPKRKPKQKQRRKPYKRGRKK